MKKAFSLIELMIVIVIIGVVYTLAITKLKSFGEEKELASFINLKDYLGAFVKDGANSARFLCLDDCTECDIYIDDIKAQTQDSFFDDSVEVYRYDAFQGPIEKKKDVFFNKEDVQERVCFSFSVNKNLVSDQVIVVYKDKAYDYSSYFDKTLEYDSLEEAVEARENLARGIMQ